MIIRMMNSTINNHAVAALLAVNPQLMLEEVKRPYEFDESDRTLTILDLNANGLFQTIRSPRILAQQLEEHGFLEHVDTIQLLISDIVPSKTMLGYATALSQAILTLKPESNITIAVPNDMTECTLIVPPSDSYGDWIVYAKPSYEVSQLVIPPGAHPLMQGNFGFYAEHMSTILFQGSIEARLENDDCRINPEKVRETYDLGL